MKNLIFSILSAAFCLGAVYSSNVQAQSANASAGSSATILTAISLSSSRDLQFGSVAVNSSTGTVALTAASSTVRSNTGGATAVNQGTSPTSATFTATGEAGYTYSVTLPSSNVTLTNTTGVGAETMTVNSFTKSLAGNGTLTGGTETFYVGGTLNTGASQVAGVYTGSFDVTVTYN